MYFGVKGVDNGVIVPPIKGDIEFKKEETLALKKLDSLIKDDKTIKHILVRRAIETKNNDSREILKDLSVKYNFWLKPLDRFLFKCVVGIGSRKPKKEEIVRVYSILRIVHNEIFKANTFTIEKLFKEMEMDKMIKSKKTIGTSDFHDLLVSIVPLSMTFNRFMKLLSEYTSKTKGNSMKKVPSWFINNITYYQAVGGFKPDIDAPPDEIDKVAY